MAEKLMRTAATRFRSARFRLWSPFFERVKIMINWKVGDQVVCINNRPKSYGNYSHLASDEALKRIFEGELYTIRGIKPFTYRFEYEKFIEYIGITLEEVNNNDLDEGEEYHYIYFRFRPLDKDENKTEVILKLTNSIERELILTK